MRQDLPRRPSLVSVEVALRQLLLLELSWREVAVTLKLMQVQELELDVEEELDDEEAMAER